jgi:Domain of unknown function (DUF4483)
MVNPLLIKDEIGKHKESIYNLPSETFAFGKPSKKDVETAKSITMNWYSPIVVHTTHKHPTELKDILRKKENMIIYGKPNRPCTPISEIVKNQFGNIGELEAMKRAEMVKKEKQKSKLLLGKPTKASDAHSVRKRKPLEAETVEKKEPFKLTRFKNIPSKIKI